MRMARTLPRALVKARLPGITDAVAAVLLYTPAAIAGPLSVTAVEFAAPATVELQSYGADEGPVLRAAILAAVSRETARLAIAKTLTATIVVQDIAPTHPTRKQLSDNPGLHAVRSKSLGGAEMTGYLRDQDQHVVSTVTLRHFAPTLEEGSASADPWADARLAIDRFAAKLAAACRDRADDSNTSR